MEIGIGFSKEVARDDSRKVTWEDYKRLCPDKKFEFTLYSDGFQTFKTITHDQKYILHHETVPKHMHIYTEKYN